MLEVLIPGLLLCLWGWDAFCWHLFISDAGPEARLEMNALLRICFSNSSSRERLPWLVDPSDQPDACSIRPSLASPCRERREEQMYQGKSESFSPTRPGKTPPSEGVVAPWGRMLSTNPAPPGTQQKEWRRRSPSPRVVGG